MALQPLQCHIMGLHMVLHMALLIALHTFLLEHATWIVENQSGIRIVQAYQGP